MKRRYFHKLDFFRRDFIIFIFGAVVFFTSACNEKQNSLPAGRDGRGIKVPVEVMIVQPQLLTDEIFSTGSIIPNERVELRNEMAGRITGIFFEEGTEISKGKLLLKINDSELKAQLSKIEAQENLIEQEEIRKRKLLEIKAISQEDYDITKIQLKTIRAEKDLILAQISKTEIYAPFSGKLGLRNVSPGSYLAINSLITTLQQTDPVKIEFSISEKYSGMLKPGMPINFTVENTTLKFKGKIYAVEASVNPQTRTITARALSPNTSGDLIPGTFARINFILNRIQDAVLIPSEAVNTEIDGSSIYLYREGKAKYVKVTTGLRTPTDIQIVEGLQKGDSLIITGLLQISDGTAVDPEIVSGQGSTIDE